MVKKEEYAFPCEANTAFPIISETFSQREICDLNIIQFRPTRMQGLLIKRNSSFHDIFAVKYDTQTHTFYLFNFVLLWKFDFFFRRFFWMRETGLLSKHIRHWVAQKPTVNLNAYKAKIIINLFIRFKYWNINLIPFQCFSKAFFKSIGLPYTIAAFGVLITGYILSIIILCLEITIHFFVKKSNDSSVLFNLRNRND